MIAYYHYAADPLFILVLLIILVAFAPAWGYNREWGYHPFGIILLLIILLLLFGCSQGRYVGPSVGANVGYQGVSVGVALYGPNPSASNVTVATASPTPTPSPVPVAAK